MLWRTSFHPDVRYSLRTPEIEGNYDLVIGVFSLVALAELEIWRRLAMEAEIRFCEGFWLTEAEAEQLPLLLAPSRLSAAHLGVDREAWLTVLDPVPIDGAFATSSATTIIGPCTEDAWELMLNRLKIPLPTLE